MSVHADRPFAIFFALIAYGSLNVPYVQAAQMGFQENSTPLAEQVDAEVQGSPLTTGDLQDCLPRQESGQEGSEFDSLTSSAAISDLSSTSAANSATPQDTALPSSQGGSNEDLLLAQLPLAEEACCAGLDTSCFLGGLPSDPIGALPAAAVIPVPAAAAAAAAVAVAVGTGTGGDGGPGTTPPPVNEPAESTTAGLFALVGLAAIVFARKIRSIE